MSERGNPQFLQVLVCQIRQNGETDVILDKALRVLPEPKLLKPVRNRLHRDPRQVSPTFPHWIASRRLPTAHLGAVVQRAIAHASRGRQTMIEFLGRAFAPVATILSFIAGNKDTQES